MWCLKVIFFYFGWKTHNFVSIIFITKIKKMKSFNLTHQSNDFLLVDFKEIAFYLTKLLLKLLKQIFIK